MHNSTRKRIIAASFTLFVLSLAVAGFRPSAAAPAPERPDFTSGPMVVLRAGYDPSSLRVPPPQRFSIQGVKSATINVNYVGTWDASAQTAFQYAVDIWESQINSSVVIEIDAYWRSLGAGVLGSARATGWFGNFTNAPVTNTWYPIALANALAGQDINESDGWDDDNDGLDADAEIIANFNKDFTDWYFGTDGNTPWNKWDFASVVLHEIGHGLGFAGSMIVSGGQGYWAWGGSPPYPAIYDRFTENGSNQALINFSNGSTDLAAQLQSNNLYFDGTNTNAANGGSPAKLYAPGSWQQGSSYSHLDEVFNGTANALMTYALDPGESLHNPGPVMLGMFQDMGWTLTSQQPDLSLAMQTVGGPDFDPGDPVTFTLSIENGGNADATGVVLTDTLPADILTPSWSASASLAGATTRGGTTYVWDLPDMAASASGIITVSGTISSGLSPDFAIVNWASISTDDTESNDDNNTSAAIVGGQRNYLPMILRND